MSLGGTRSLDAHCLDHCAHLETERRRRAMGGRGGRQAAHAHCPSGPAFPGGALGGWPRTPAQVSSPVPEVK